MKSLIELQSVDLLMDSCLKEISFIENEINDNSRLESIQTKINQLKKNIDILNKALNQLNISIETNKYIKRYLDSIPAAANTPRKTASKKSILLLQKIFQV